MKIVDRKTFLAMPEGVVFQKVDGVGLYDVCIKGRTVADVDFYSQDLETPIGLSVAVRKARADGSPLRLNLDGECKDGMFEADQLFAVWDAEDIKVLQDRLAKCIPAP